MRLPLLLTVVSAVCLASEDAPVSLTASDGTGLKLVKLEAAAVVQDPLAFTELKLTFENPLDRVLEGQFKVTLPQGAAISRFAMKIDGRWQEGEVVEKQAARRAYEDFLHRRQDPALLEQNGGNEFAARVFPIPARGQKEIIVSYSHDLVAANAPYTVYLKGLPEVGSLKVTATGVTGTATLEKTKFVPNADFVAMPVRSGAGVRSGDLVAARVVPVANTAPEMMNALTLLVDSSGSRALGWKDQVALVKALIAELAKGQPSLNVSVVAFDQDVVPMFSGAASSFGEADAKKLFARQALGASNVELALQYLASKPTDRAVIISDGVLTAGAVEGQNLVAQVLKLKSGVKRLDAIAVGGIRDEGTLARLVQGNLERDGAVLDGSQPVLELASRLRLSTKSKLKVQVEGATAVWPTELSGIQAGDAVLVYAQLKGDAFKVNIGGVALPIAALTQVDRPLLERAWARAQISALEAKLNDADGPNEKKKLKDEIVSISTKQRVLSSQTALLVLETENDYARFNIDRKALADILTVEGGKVARFHRDAQSVVVAKAPPPPVVKKPEPAKKMKASTGANLEMSLGGAAAPKPADEGSMGKRDSAGADDMEAEKSAVAREEAPPPAAPPPPPAAVAAAPRADERRVQASPIVQPTTPAVQPVMAESQSQPAPSPEQNSVDPYIGQFKTVMDALKTDKPKAVALARGWHEEQPGDLLALVAYGEVLEATGDVANAARAYGSIIDLFPSRADLRRFAGVRLERLTSGLNLATDTFEKALEQRPDHPESCRLFAYALIRAGRFEKAFEVLAKGAKAGYPSGRFLGVDRILTEDLGLAAAAWAKADPNRRGEIMQKLKSAGGVEESAPSIRFVLNWETDANDVDFHIYDAKGGHAYYSSKVLPSGGELYADVTTGYGPECFTIRLPKDKRAYPYTLQAHYYSIGPMGAGMGKLEIIEHDGKGGLRFEERPYVVMVNQAFVDLGTVTK